jgi:hypothetical protein
MANESLLQRIKALEERLAERDGGDAVRTANVLTLDERARLATAGISPHVRPSLQRQADYPKVLYSAERPDGVQVEDRYSESELREKGGTWVESPEDLPPELLERFYSHMPGDPVQSLRERARALVKQADKVLTAMGSERVQADKVLSAMGPIPERAPDADLTPAVTRRPRGRPPKRAAEPVTEE